jgi:pimeloyl-ACP methyl ester carboxylesterase
MSFLAGTAALGVAGAGGLGGLVSWAARDLASPLRSPLRDHHIEFLEKTSVGVVRVERFTLADGTPCLFCEPDRSGGLGERGLLLREQLEARGHRLSSAGAATASAVLVHGRNARKEDLLPVAERLCAAGFRCVLPDMPAHGEHPAALATYGLREAVIPAAALAEAARVFGFDSQPAVLFGLSMGGSVAVHAAALPGAEWRALVVIASYHSFAETVRWRAGRVVAQTLGSGIGSRMGGLLAGAVAIGYQSRTGVSLSEIQPVAAAARLSIPTFIAHGTEDVVVPFQSGRSLFEALPETTRRQWVTVDGAGHNNILITDFPLYATFTGWLLEQVGR